MKNKIKSKLRKIATRILNKTGGLPLEVDVMSGNLRAEFPKKYCSVYIGKTYYDIDNSHTYNVRLYVDGIGSAESTSYTSALEELKRKHGVIKKIAKNPVDLNF